MQISLGHIKKKKCSFSITEELLVKVATEFEKRANFPQVIGTINGKHIRVVKPANSASIKFNYKHYFSIFLLGVFDYNKL